MPAHCGKQKCESQPHRENTTLYYFTCTASAGISLNCLVSKICSDLNKPNGQYELLEEDAMREFVSQLPIRKVGGIGNVTEQLLEVIGIKICQVNNFEFIAQGQLMGNI